MCIQKLNLKGEEHREGYLIHFEDELRNAAK